jgi:hypothetical protein
MNPLNLVIGDATVYNLVLAETSKGQPFPLGAGPFTVAVADPNGILKVTAGSPDNTTPTTFQLAGAGAVGTATVTVTDTQFNLVGTGEINAAAAPPAVPDTLTVDFVAAPAAAAAVKKA